jgi:DNA mismatch endonuclease, patch repair protein
MADVFSPEKRSQIMSRISGKETGPEIVVRRYLFAEGFRFRKNDLRLPGKPDIVLPKFRTVIFVHGCFWHGHKNCRYAALPKTNTVFWRKKIEGNVRRDIAAQRSLRELGWRVIIVWQCRLRNHAVCKATLQRVINRIQSKTR